MQFHKETIGPIGRHETFSFYTWAGLTLRSCGGLTVCVLCAEMRSIRLTGGADRCSGKLEVHRNGSWGTVCDNCWNERLASMVCSMLRCGPTALNFSQFVPPLVHNQGPQWYYQCNSRHQNLWQCMEIVNSTHLCKDSKASGVICEGENSISYKDRNQMLPKIGF